MQKYLYIHLNPINGIIFYVGVGKVHEDRKSFYKRYNRAFAKTARGRTKHWMDEFNKNGREVQILKVSENIEEIYELETVLINFIGRKDKEEGPLVNRTDGKFLRDSGRIFSEKHKEKISIYHKSLNLYGENNPYYGKKHTEEIKKKMRGKRPNSCGKNHPKTNWILNISNGIYYESIKEVSDIYNINYQTLRSWLNPNNNVKNKSNFITT